MRIGLQTWGTDGDFMPFLALSIGLKQAGHQVTLAYTSVDGKSYSSLSETHGIELIEANGGISARTDVNPYAIAAKPGSFREYSTLLKLYFDPFAEAMYSASEKLCRENDLVIGHAACHTLLTASQKYHCPRIPLVLTPLVVRSKFISPLGTDLGTTINALMWWMGDKVSTRLWFRSAQAIRRRQGIPPIKSLQHELFTSNKLTLIAASPLLTHRMKDWNDSVHVTGFLNLPEPPSDQQMPEDLKRFIQSGEPPVYMTFGSCTQFDLENSTRLMIDAAKLSGQRTIIQTDLSAHSFGTDPNIHFIGRAPHSVVFPLCSAIVHHGGAGTTQAALLAGKPSVVVAHGFDQPYWGRLLEKAGASGKCLTRNGLSADQLAAQIEAVTSAASISIHADRLGKAMKQEHGVARAIEAIAAMNI